VLFSALTDDVGYEPWLSDGTPEGTTLLRDIAPGAVSSTPSGYQVAGGRAWFIADDGVHGREVWVTDGSTTGTRLVRDVVPGTGDPDAEPVAIAAGKPLFSMTTTAHGTELWLVDEAGDLREAADLLPGVASSDPLPIGVVANTLVFQATGPGGPRIHALTVQPSSTTVRKHRKYTRRAARKRRIVIPVRVTAVGTAPVGTVTLVRKGRVVGRAVLRDGVARVRVKVRLRPGRHRLQARYAGSVVAQRSSSPTFRIRIR
jgi:ELWxxDGT repeat protein